MPRFIFSNSNHLNTDIFDEKNQKLYTIKTPLALNRVTTITKYVRNEEGSFPETMAIIEWRIIGSAIIRFQEKVINADKMLESRMLEFGRYFTGPDDKSYQWKMELNHCWLKPADAETELAKFYRKTYGIIKEYRPPHLEVSCEAVGMLDHVILTYVYVETLRQDVGKHMSSNINGNVIKIANLANTTVQNMNEQAESRLGLASGSEPQGEREDDKANNEGTQG